MNDWQVFSRYLTPWPSRLTPRKLNRAPAEAAGSVSCTRYDCYSWRLACNRSTKESSGRDNHPSVQRPERVSLLPSQDSCLRVIRRLPTPP